MTTLGLRMNQAIGTRSLSTWLGVAWVGLCLTACGGQSVDPTSASRAKSTEGHSSASSSAFPVPRKAFGDYDKDDYGAGDDADNDDSHTPKDRDNDSDNPTGSYFDGDDRHVLDYGRAVSIPERRAIAGLVKRYYAAAAAGDGTAACKMLVASLANSVAEDLGRPPGPDYLRGDSCDAVMSKVFELNHAQLSAYNAEFDVAAVRSEHDSGVVVMDFKGLPGRSLLIRREQGAWKIGELLDDELP